jgi:ribose transport system ATP-binding protein
MSSTTAPSPGLGIAPGPGEGAPALSVAGLSKTFGATKALDDVTFSISSGSIHGLLGGNGSGKSTLIKVLAGVYQADAGEVDFSGTTVEASSITPQLAADRGLRFVHQHPPVFGNLTVAENIAIGGGPGFPTRAGVVNWGALKRRTVALLERFEIDVRPGTMGSDLRPADQTMIAIARALQDVVMGDDTDNRAVLVLDEPTASLPDHEVQVLLAALRRLAASGQTIVYVSHRLEEVNALVDELTILRDGKHITTRSAHGLGRSGLVELIVGRELADSERVSRVESDAPFVLDARGLAGGPLRDVDLTVREGEVLGIAGLLGSGRTHLLRGLFGDRAFESGEMALGGETVTLASPSDAIERGIAYVAEDRAADAAFPGLSVRTNGSASDIRTFGRFRFDKRAEREHMERAVEAFSIKTDGTEAVFSTLSGGNQQKVMLARWLLKQQTPRLLLLDEPTQGIDVGARADVYEAVGSAVQQGLGVVLVASDFEELAAQSDRVIVLHDGRIVAEVSGSSLTAAHLTELAHHGELEVHA